MVNKYLSEQSTFSKKNFSNQSFIAEGVTVISEDTYGQLMDTFENVEQEEFFEVFIIDKSGHDYIILFPQVWDNTELVPHEENNKVYLKLNFKLHIYFAVQKINLELEPVADCLQQVDAGKLRFKRFKNNILGEAIF